MLYICFQFMNSELKRCCHLKYTLILRFFKIILGPQDPKELDPRLICPLFDILFPYLPEKIRKPLRFGVRHGEVINRIQ